MKTAPSRLVRCSESLSYSEEYMETQKAGEDPYDGIEPPYTIEAGSEGVVLKVGINSDVLAS